MKNIIFCLIIVFLVLASCKKNSNENSADSKFTEKNPINFLDINTFNGNIEIYGWGNDFTEIGINKKIIKGLDNDLKLMGVAFDYSDAKLKVTGKIPDRIIGEINLKIFVPFNLFKIIITANNCNVKIDKYLGDVELNNNKGLIDINFQGDILRIASENSLINLNIQTYSTSDVIVKNKEGEINTKINVVRENSFLDLVTLNGNISISISKDIPHRFSITDKNEIKVNYNFWKITSLSGEYKYLVGLVNNDSYKIDISTTNGIVTLNQF